MSDEDPDFNPGSENARFSSSRRSSARNAKSNVTTGPIRDPINDYFTFVKKEGKSDLVECQFCGLQRLRIPIRLKQHIVMKCTGDVPLDIRKRFEGRDIIDGKVFERKVPPELLSGQVPAKSKSKNVATSAADDVDDDDGRSNKPKTEAEMVVEEHLTRMKLLRAETSYFHNQEKIYQQVGQGVTSFLSTCDDFLRRLRGKSMVFGGIALQFGEGGKSSSSGRRSTVASSSARKNGAVSSPKKRWEVVDDDGLEDDDNEQEVYVPRKRPRLP